MSYAKKSYTKANKKNPILCGFCRKAGRIDEAHEHSLKDKNGNVCCPFLANITCSYCEKTGHTSTRCDERIKGDKYIRDFQLRRYCEAKAEKKAHQEALKEKQVQVKKPTNVFACLYESDSDSPRVPSGSSQHALVKKPAAIVFSLATTTTSATPTAADPYPLVGVTRVIATYYGSDERIPSDSDLSDSDDDDEYDPEVAAIDWAERWR
jgi:hypothetical protein